jgi:hypothetical protein
MERDLADSTATVALQARASFAALAHPGGVDEPRMAKVAQSAIFAEALMNALHARLTELRTVAK